MIKNKEDLIHYIEQDRLMNGASKKRSIKESIIEVILPYSILTYLRILRYAEYYNNSNSFISVFMKFIYRYRLMVVSRKLGFQISINTCGAGLSLPHFGPIIINSKAKIGENCRIHTCVNIGATNGSKMAPRIGNNVYIGPSAVIFGDITIADNITIGANATVNKTFNESNTTIAGTPANIIKQNTLSWVETINKNSNDLS